MKVYIYRTIAFKEDAEAIRSKLDGKKVWLQAEVVPKDKLGTPEEEAETTTMNVQVFVSGSEISPWGLGGRDYKPIDENENLKKVLYEYCKKYLEQKLQEGVVEGTFEHDESFLSRTDPSKFNPERINVDFGLPHEVEVSRPIGFKP